MHSRTQRQDCLYHRNLIPGSITGAVTATFGKEWASTLVCVSERWTWTEIWIVSLVLVSLALLEEDHTYKWTTDTHTHTHALLKRWLRIQNTDFPTARTQTHTDTHFQLRRKLLRQQSQRVRACVFTFEYEVNSGYHWEDQSHPARIGNHKTT